MKFAFFLVLSLVIFSFSANSAFAQSSGSKGLIVQKVKPETETEIAFNRPRIIKPEERSESAASGASSLELFGFEKQVFAMINQKRAEQNLPALEWSDEVAAIARMHSQNMATYKFFSHAGLDGAMVSDRADHLGIKKWHAIGENIAYNRGFKLPLDVAVDGWMHSQGHRENLLDARWKESAIGIARADDGTFYFTQVFLQRK